MWIISFWIFPLISACMWLAMLLAMLGNWAAVGKPIYESMEEGQSIAYISDIGVPLKGLFIPGSVITVVFLDLAFLSERWLRHAGQLVPNKGFFDKACAVLSIIASIAGAVGLILLSIFDTLHHSHLHTAFLILFMVGYLVSAILICAEYLRIGIFYRSQHKILLVSFGIKLSFIIVEIALAIGFGVCGRGTTPARTNASAVLEWVIAFVFTFYILSFVIDLLPSVRTRTRVPQGEKRLEMAQPGPNPPPFGDMAYGDNMAYGETGDPNADYYYRGQRMI